VSAVEAAAMSAREAALEARSAAEEVSRSQAAISRAVADAREAAESSRQSASLVEQAGGHGISAGASGALLERLEADYSMLARLIQDLQDRLGSFPRVPLSSPTLVDVEMHVPPPPDSADTLLGFTDEYHQRQEVRHLPSPEVAGIPGHLAPSEAPSADEPVPGVATEMEAALPSGTGFPLLAGCVDLRITPVPDFDRLLNLDSALSRTGAVHNVTLAAFAGGEVTFRVELAYPMEPAELARQFGLAAGVPAEVVEASEASLRIRVA
jgi:hypothetical protein